ncbi:MAG TPA: four-carbon acid sugar kinase family protein [Acidimicrobiales bacterium]|nr:four-carbon acid sugar kinase family protein [Acidimicrobiales bacterium]
MIVPESNRSVPDRPVPEEVVTAGLPAPIHVGAAAVADLVAASGRRLVVLDDDPTGTQTVADVPVLTTWSVEDLRWGLRQGAPAVYVLTNSRSLSPADAAARNRQVLEALVPAAAAEHVGYVVTSRSDSTLRGHFPLETDVVADTLLRLTGEAVDGVVVVPAYIEGGRITVGSRHWVRTAAGMVPAGRSEFAGDATFGYRSSDLPDYVEEKSAGRWKAADVARITVEQLRGDRSAADRVLLGLSDGQPVVVDAVDDEDLRSLSLALLAAEAAGKRFVYRVGPSFVRARAGLDARPPLSAEAIRSLAGGSGDAQAGGSGHGLVVVGSHVRQTTRQLEELRAAGGFAEIELDVPRLLDAPDPAAVVADVADRAIAALASGDVVVSTSRAVVTGGDADASLAVAGTVSMAVVDVVRDVVQRSRPAWIVAKGGITSSDVATRSLGIRRAWVRGTLLPGIISLWEPVDSGAPGTPYVVFAGNVGGDDALVRVVAGLREALDVGSQAGGAGAGGVDPGGVG